MRSSTPDSQTKATPTAETMPTKATHNHQPSTAPVLPKPATSVAAQTPQANNPTTDKKVGDVDKIKDDLVKLIATPPLPKATTPATQNTESNKDHKTTPPGAPSNTGHSQPQSSLAESLARVKARQEAQRIEREERKAKKRAEQEARLKQQEELRELREKTAPRPKPKKGEYIAKLKAMEFEKFTDEQAQVIYKWMQEYSEKSGLHRSNAVKVLFTDAEYELIGKIASGLKIEKSKAVRRLCFTGPSNSKVLEEYLEIRRTLKTYSSNLNQVMNYLNSKKVNITEEKAGELLRITRGIKEQIQELDRRLAR